MGALSSIVRAEMADIIADRLEADIDSLKAQFAASIDKIGYFYVDDLLPAEIADRIYRAFPAPEKMMVKRSLREYKFVAAQMDNYDPILEEAIYAFQAPRVVDLIRDICQMKSAYPDEHLYAGGISMMGDKQFLNPHLDNSHDKDRDRWRVLNLLYYVTPDWNEASGGNLEIWPDGLAKPQTTIHSKFNRLAVMATHGSSLHSVSPVQSDRFRCCVSNYYFSDEPLKETDKFHVTSFRGRPEQPVVDAVLQADALVRSGVRKIFRKGVRENPHVYKR